jgi:hypothetical protein
MLEACCSYFQGLFGTVAIVYINFAKNIREGYTAIGMNAPQVVSQRAGPFTVLEIAGGGSCLVDITKE